MLGLHDVLTIFVIFVRVREASSENQARVRLGVWQYLLYPFDLAFPRACRRVCRGDTQQLTKLCDTFIAGP